jgi:hypothetical protein
MNYSGEDVPRPSYSMDSEIDKMIIFEFISDFEKLTF